MCVALPPPNCFIWFFETPGGFFTKHVHLREIDSDIKGYFYSSGLIIFRLYTVSLAEIREMGENRLQQSIFRSCSMVLGVVWDVFGIGLG